MCRLARLVATLLPARLRLSVRRLRRWAKAALLRGGRVECPICGGRFRRFLSSGDPPRRGAECPRCGALERHRLLWLYLARETRLLAAAGRILDVAPGAAVAAAFRRAAGNRYLSVNLLPADGAQVLADVAALPFGDGAFGAVLCIHVLEHVPDDRAAMRELARVLRPGGLALVMSPADPARERALEDSRAQTPEERRRLFGQADHVRVYGRDLPDRLAGEGLEVRPVSYVSLLPAEEVGRHGLREDHVIYRCTRSG